MALIPDKLMIVAHPDDEILWGGGNLIAQPGWMVIVATHNHDSRSAEFYKTMSDAGVYECKMYNIKDEYTESITRARQLIKGNKQFMSALKTLAKRKWKLVLTHNNKGEYGHVHHIVVGEVVKHLFPKAKTFAISKNPLPKDILARKIFLNRWYKETQAISKHVYQKNWQDLKKVEREHILNEKLYVPIAKPVITPVIHQIWFGNAPARWKKYLLDMVKKNAGANVDYKLWTTKDLTFKNFPLTWKAIQKARAIGNTRWAQVADLARYEIIYRYGGVYLDSNFEISDKLWPAIVKSRGKFVGANEDPCNLSCKGWEGKRYLSNGFFAAIPHHPVLQTLVSQEFLSNIDFEEVRVNRTTGPYALGGAIKSVQKNGIKLLPMNKIYPFMVNDSGYRKAKPNKCLSKENGNDKVKVNNETFLLKDCLEKKYPNTYAVYQSGLGGSWSWD